MIINGANIFVSHQLNQRSLESLQFIEKKENVILVGSPGTGKSHLATALGQKSL